jgi:CRP/FNR family transcriptional regulator
MSLLRDELDVGRQKLRASFRSLPPRPLKARELLMAARGSSGAIYHLRSGWACQFRDFRNGHRAIIDIYLPGDIIGLDAIFRIRPPEEVLTLTSATIEATHASDALLQFMACHSTALFVLRLLGERQRRVDRHLAAVSCLDARGRLAMMMLELYLRLRRKKLITGLEYNLPLTQGEIGRYLGLTVVHVNRVFGSLRDERIAHLERHRATILDLERLKSLAQNGGVASWSARIGERALQEAAD